MAALAVPGAARAADAYMTREATGQSGRNRPANLYRSFICKHLLRQSRAPAPAAPGNRLNWMGFTRAAVPARHDGVRYLRSLKSNVLSPSIRVC